MKKVNLYGMTTAEKLVALERAYNELLDTIPEIIARVGFICNEDFVDDDTQYNLASIVNLDNEILTIGNKVLFNNGSIGYVTSVGENIFTAKFMYSDIGPKGDKGTSITGFSTIKFTNRGDNTVTEVQAETTDGNFPFDIYAANGGGGGSSVNYVYINLPETATSGTFSEQELNILLGSKENKIVFNNEIYFLQDNQHETGYLIYTHIGHNSLNKYFVKCITITINTRAWVLSSIEIKETEPFILKYYKISFPNILNVRSEPDYTSSLVEQITPQPIISSSEDFFYTAENVPTFKDILFLGVEDGWFKVQLGRDDTFYYVSADAITIEEL